MHPLVCSRLGLILELLPRHSFDQQHCTFEYGLSGGIQPVSAEPEMQTQLPAALRTGPDLPVDEPHGGLRSIIMGWWWVTWMSHHICSC